MSLVIRNNILSDSNITLTNNTSISIATIVGNRILILGTDTSQSTLMFSDDVDVWAIQYTSGAYATINSGSQLRVLQDPVHPNDLVRKSYIDLLYSTSSAYGTVKLFSDTVQSVAATAVSSTASRTYGIQVNASGQLVVNIPWTNTTYPTITLPVLTAGVDASNGVLSAITLNSWLSSKGYISSIPTLSQVLTAGNNSSGKDIELTSVDGYGSYITTDSLDSDIYSVLGAGYIALNEFFIMHGFSGYAQLGSNQNIRSTTDPFHIDDYSRKAYVDTKFPIPTGTTSEYIRGDGSLSTFPTIPTVSPSALTRVNDTNVTLTLGGTPNTALLQNVSLTLGWTSTLSVARGGSGAATLTGILVGNGTSAFTGVVGTANQLLRRNTANTAYEFFTPTYISGNQTITLSGNVTGSGTTAITTTIANGAVTLARMANLAANSIIGNNTESATAPIALTPAQVRTMLNVANGATANTGTVTQVAMIVPTGFSVSGSPINTSGTFTISYVTGYTGYTTAEQTKLSGIATNANNYTLPTATSSVLGGIKLFSNTVQSVVSNAVSTTASRTYGIQVNANGQLVVNIPWTDTVYTHPNSGVAAGTYNNVTVNVQGHVTSGSNVSYEASFSKGNIIQGTGVSISGTLTNRLVGSGDITINATATAQNLGWTSSTGNLSISSGNTVSLDGRYLRILRGHSVNIDSETSAGQGYWNPTTTDTNSILPSAYGIWVNFNAFTENSTAGDWGIQFLIPSDSNRIRIRRLSGPSTWSIASDLLTGHTGVVTANGLQQVNSNYTSLDADTATPASVLHVEPVSNGPNSLTTGILQTYGVTERRYQFFIGPQGDNNYYRARLTAAGGYGSWYQVASRAWVTTNYATISSLSNYVTTNTTQTVTAEKTWTGVHTFSGNNITLNTDNTGITLYGGARVYKKSGSGLILKRANDAIDVQIENAAATASYRIFSEDWSLMRGFTSNWDSAPAADIGLKSGFYYANTASVTDKPTADNFHLIHVSHYDSASYWFQIGAPYIHNTKVYVRRKNNTVTENWTALAYESWVTTQLASYATTASLSNYVPQTRGLSFTSGSTSGLSVSGTASTNLSVDRTVTYTLIFGTGAGQVAQGNDSRINNGQTAYGWGDYKTRSINTSGSITGGGNLSTDRTLSLVGDNGAPGGNQYYGTNGAGSKGWWSLPSVDLSGYVQNSRNINTTSSLQGGGNLSSDRTLSLVGDNGSPGGNKYYGTNGGGSKGFWDLPSVSGYVPTNRAVNTSGSIQGGGWLDVDRTFSLVGDNGSPGNNKYYGTNGGGEKGWWNLPSGGGGNITGSGSNGYITMWNGGTSITNSIMTQSSGSIYVNGDLWVSSSNLWAGNDVYVSNKVEANNGIWAGAHSTSSMNSLSIGDGAICYNTTISEICVKRSGTWYRLTRGAAI